MAMDTTLEIFKQLVPALPAIWKHVCFQKPTDIDERKLQQYTEKAEHCPNRNDQNPQGNCSIALNLNITHLGID